MCSSLSSKRSFYFLTQIFFQLQLMARCRWCLQWHWYCYRTARHCFKSPPKKRQESGRAVQQIGHQHEVPLMHLRLSMAFVALIKSLTSFCLDVPALPFCPFYLDLETGTLFPSASLASLSKAPNCYCSINRPDLKLPVPHHVTQNHHYYCLQVDAWCI